MVAMGIWYPWPMQDGDLRSPFIRTRTPVLILSVNSLDQAVEAAEPATPSWHTLTYFEKHDGPVDDRSGSSGVSFCYSNAWEFFLR